jgi:predicted nucleic acid-binding protein
MLVVADTSPLNYLVWIEAVELLRLLYGRIVIPPEVRDELTVADAPAMIRAWADNLPDWFEICPCDAALRDDPRWRVLDPGERAAIALAVTRKPAILLIDERAGTEVAREQGIPVLGTLGVLDEAARRELISLPEVIERLKQTSFRYPRAVVARLLEEDAKRRSSG